MFEPSELSACGVRVAIRDSQVTLSKVLNKDEFSLSFLILYEPNKISS